MSRSMTKSQLAAEMAQRAETSAKSMLIALDTLAEIAYRETQNGFVIPGICKLSTAKRKPRKFRHPITGELFQIGERLAVTVTPVKKCKMQAVPQQENLITPALESAKSNEPDAPTGISTAPAPEQPPAPATAPFQPPPAPIPSADPASIVLECEHCGNTVAAPAEYAGMLGQCPFCNGEISIPTLESQAAPTLDPTHPAPPKDTAVDFMGFVTFFCNACGQEIEAPQSMMGAEANCPSCGGPVFVPAENQECPVAETNTQEAAEGDKKIDRNSMTIRIDLSDLT